MSVKAEALVAFACAPETTADDGSSVKKNGLFTKHLLEHLKTPNEDIRTILNRVRDGVMKDSNNQQIPHVTYTLRSEDICFYKSNEEQNTKDSIKTLNDKKNEDNLTKSSVSGKAPIYMAASLYVGNLHPDVTETMLFDKFACAGPVLSIRVCRDMMTRRSLGYAYVNFQQPADAERVLDTMNFDLLLGRELRIILIQRDSAFRQSDVGTVFISNLDTNVGNKSLYDVFSAFGNILSCQIIKDEAGQSKGYGFVHFETDEAADNTINKVNGMLLGDKKVFVGRLWSRKYRTDPGGPQKFTNIFIKNFGNELDEEKLRELLSKYGKISLFGIERDENGGSKGFGFCNFEKPEEAEEAVQNLNGYCIGDKQLYVARFQEKNERLSEIERKKDAQRQEHMNKDQGVNLYIKNLDDTIDDERLRKEFSKFGTITSARIMSENGRSRGFGFVCFSAPDEATKAVTEMNGSVFGSKLLYVALAQRKEERRMHLTNQHMQRIATSRVPTQMQLPFPNGMPGVMSYIPTPMGPSQPRGFFPPTAMPTYRAAQPRWSSAAAAGMRPHNQSGFGNSIIVAGHEPLTLAELANATPQDRKQMLGERLFPLVQNMQPDLAGKITGMLLELDNTEILHMLESRESLKAKVEEAIALLQAHQAKQHASNAADK
ncbi:hypothetical protein I4U23_011367 [Adineta vaga]|nr:hypothetical protein I4U23_011367 [Adineta vaga]